VREGKRDKRAGHTGVKITTLFCTNAVRVKKPGLKAKETRRRGETDKPDAGSNQVMTCGNGET